MKEIFIEQKSHSDVAQNNSFFDTIRKVIRTLDLDDNNPCSRLVVKNIRAIAIEIENNIDVYLEELKIPFRTEEFLLILFQALYEDKLCSDGKKSTNRSEIYKNY
jgi:hypothetical protein